MDRYPYQKEERKQSSLINGYFDSSIFSTTTRNREVLSINNCEGNMVKPWYALLQYIPTEKTMALHFEKCKT